VTKRLRTNLLLLLVGLALVLLGSPAALAAGELVPAASEGATAQSPDIVVVVDPMQENAEPFGPVIGDAARFKLQSVGLLVQVDSLMPSEDANPLPRAKSSGASAVLVCSYRVEGAQMVVVLGWYDPDARATAASAEARGDLDLRLDVVILSALNDLLGKVQDKVQALAARKAGFRPATPPGEDQGAPLQPARPPEETPAPVTAQGPDQPTLRFLIAGGFAPFVPTGAASAYFAFGYLPSTLADFLVPIKAGYIGIGLYTGVDYFTAVGSIDTSNTFLIPAGLDFRYEIDAGAFRPFFHVAAGPALLVMATASHVTIIWVMPFLKSGLGLGYWFGGRVAAAIVADYDVYFEMPYLITGFAPSVLVEVGL